MSDEHGSCINLILKQIQPIHIGKGSYGVVDETRIFIPGWTMWGALTKAYGLSKNWSKDDWESEENKKVFENVSCFYPCFDDSGNYENILFPKFKNGKFYLGDYSEDEFRAKFVDTFVSTAINPLSQSATDESLHELNIILPRAKADYLKKDSEKQIYWVGVVNINKEEEVKDFLKEGAKIYVGGDVKYGLGEMEIIKIKKNIDCNIWKIKGNTLINYLPFDISGKNNVNVIGKLELIVKLYKPWEHADLQVKDYRMCFVPGSRINGILDTEKFSVDKGILINN